MPTKRPPVDPAVLDQMIAELDTKLPPRVRERLLIAYNYARGLTVREIAVTYATSIGKVAWWIDRYRKEGLSGLEDRPGRGRRPALTPEQEQWLKERVIAGPTEADGPLSRWRGADLKALIAAEFGVELTRNSVYRILHRLNLSWICPRPQHPKSNPAAQAQFVQETTPLLSSKSRNNTQTRP